MNHTQIRDVRNKSWYLIILTVFTTLAIFVPASLSQAQENTLAACHVRDILFSQHRYEVGQPIAVTVRLDDANNVPLGGAVVRAEVNRAEVSQASTGFGLVDRVGEYDGLYSETRQAGMYKFDITASDPTGTNFAPCSASADVQVGSAGDPTSTPIPTQTPTVNPTSEPTQTPIVTVEPTATATVEPTVTVEPTTQPTSTPTNTPDPDTASVNFSPNTLTLDSCSTSQAMGLSVSGISGLVGIDVELSYNTSLLDIADADSNSDGTQINVGSLFNSGFVVENVVDKTNGTISLAATLLGDEINGDAELLSIDWLPLAEGTATIEIDDVKLADANGNPISSNLNNGTITVSATCASSLSGVIKLEGKQDASGVTVVGSTGQGVETDTEGNFSVIGGEPVIVSKPGYLSARAEVGTAAQIASGNIDYLGQIILLAGDVNNDDVINIFDLTYLASHMDTNDSIADLNGDGIVNIFDLSLAAGNYQEAGPLMNWAAE